MAKGKHSTALFEVIHTSRRSEARREQLLRTPKWWFKNHAANAPATPGRAAGSVDEDEPPIVDLVPEAEAQPCRPHVAARSVAEDKAPVGRSTIAFHLDRDRQEISLRLRYTTAIVSGFAMLVMIGLAYAVGRHIAGGPQSASAAISTETLLQGPRQPDVMDVPPRQPATQPPKAASPAAGSSNGQTTDADDSTAKPIAPAPPPAPTPGAVAETDAKRSVGLNYVIVQSYPDQAKAEEACGFLNQQGIPCTVEKIKGWINDPRWCSVVTSTGFQRIHSPEYETFARRIVALGEKYAKGSRIKRFEPHPISWK